MSVEGKKCEQWYVDASRLSDEQFKSFLEEITPAEVLVRRAFSHLRQIFQPRGEFPITNSSRLKIPSW